jgi:hypothetical protein
MRKEQETPELEDDRYNFTHNSFLYHVDVLLLKQTWMQRFLGYRGYFKSNISKIYKYK